MLRESEINAAFGDTKLQEFHTNEIALIKEIYTTAKSNTKEQNLLRIESLITLISERFAYEEHSMQKSADSAFGAHKFEHDKELLDIKSMMDFYDMTGDANSLISYLEDALVPWIIEHTQNMDMDLDQFLQTSEISH